jgi:hypothetical protein
MQFVLSYIVVVEVDGCVLQAELSLMQYIFNWSSNSLLEAAIAADSTVPITLLLASVPFPPHHNFHSVLFVCLHRREIAESVGQNASSSLLFQHQQYHGECYIIHKAATMMSFGILTCLLCPSIPSQL